MPTIQHDQPAFEEAATGRELDTMADPAASERPLAWADLWSGLVFTLVGLAFAIESWRMPRLEERGIDPWTAPGLVPGLLGSALALLGILLAARGWTESRGQPRHVSILGTGHARVRLATAFALNLTFAVLLVGRLPFWLATFVYLAVFMGVFGLKPRNPGLAGRAAPILAVATATTAGIVYLFETLFFVRLP
jgi:hypothetical protein